MSERVEIEIVARDMASGVIKNIGGSLRRIGEIALGVLTAHILPRLADGIMDFGRSVVSEAMEAEDSMAQLQAVLKSTGGVAGITAEQASKLADSMMNLTRFDDEAALSAETVLLQFTKINKEAFPEALKLSADLATRLGVDLKSAAMIVGKALGDPAEGIGRLNMQFRLFNDEEMKAVQAMAAAGDVAGAQAIIMERLAQKVGGAAEVAGKTFAGQMEILKHQVDNVKESIGMKLLPVLSQFIERISGWLAAGGAEKIAEWAAAVIGWIERVANWFGNLDASLSNSQIGPFVREVLNKFAAWFTENGPLIQTYLQKMGELFARLAPIVTAMWNVISPILMALLDAVLGLVTFVMQLATGDWAGAWETMKNVVLGWGEALFNAMLGFMNLIATVVQSGMGLVQTIWRTIWEGLKSVVASIFNGIVSFVQERIAVIIGAFGGIVTAIQGVIAWIGNLASAFASLILPEWLTPGSPTPLELGLRGINDAMSQLAHTTLPTLSAGIGGMALAPATTGITGQAVAREQTLRNVTININGTFTGANDMNYLAQEVARRLSA